jgi:hypothetical protein
MSVDKFKFVSPGIFIDEIDESSIPALPERMGPLVVGRLNHTPKLTTPMPVIQGGILLKTFLLMLLAPAPPAEHTVFLFSHQPQQTPKFKELWLLSGMSTTATFS